MKVLIVDDYPSLRELLAMQVQDYGHEARVCESAEAAITMLADYRPDIILMDTYMSGMKGYEAIPHLQRLTSARIVGMSSLDESRNWPTEFVSKEDLVDRLEDLLSD